MLRRSRKRGYTRADKFCQESSRKAAFFLVMGCEGKTDWRKKTGTRQPLLKGRLSDDSDVRPEACGASFQNSEGEHQHAFLFPNIQHSTFHQPQAGPPFSPERETCCMLSICGAFEFLPLYKRTFRFTSAICKDCTDPSRRLANL